MDYSVYKNRAILLAFLNLEHSLTIFSSLMCNNTTDIDTAVLQRIYRELNSFLAKYSETIKQLEIIQKKETSEIEKMLIESDNETGED